MIENRTTIRTPFWFWIVAILGLIWNGSGILQLQSMLFADVESLSMRGIDRNMAELFTNFPTWLIVVFTISFVSASVGCILLLFRKKTATPLFLIAFVAYIVLGLGNLIEGHFAILGAQLGVSSVLVIVFSLLLLLFSRYFKKKFVLR